MAIREVRIMGDDILEKQCKPVTKMTMRKNFDHDMLDTMYEKYGVDWQHLRWSLEADRCDRCGRRPDRADQPGDH